MTSQFARLVAASAALVLLAGCGDQSDSAGGGSAGAEASETAVITGAPVDINAADVRFASAMLKHHQQSVELSTKAVERTTNAQVLSLADQIVAVQQPEINIFNVFLVQWEESPDAPTDDGGDADPPPGTVDDATVATLAALRGPEFDALWLQSMIGLHEGGVAIANAEIADGVNVDAISVAKSVVAGLSPQIAQMKKMVEGTP